MSLPYYKRFPRDFLEGTIGLSFEVKGAYAIVLDLIYMRSGRLPDDARYIAGQLGCSVRKWTAIRAALIDAGKLTVSGGVISNSRADDLTEETRKYQDKQSEIANRPRKNKDLRQPKSIQPEPEPEVANATPVSDETVVVAKPKRAYPADFEAAWSAYPHSPGRSSKPDTLAAWRKIAADERSSLPAAAARYRREGREPKADCGAPAMERWLKRGLHQHWLTQTAAPASNGPVDPIVTARRLRHWRDTGTWDPGWGPMPDAANDQSATGAAA